MAKARKAKQAGIRMSAAMETELREYADLQEEGNFALLVRKILREWLDKRKGKK
jgi:hypothetical protein